MRYGRIQRASVKGLLMRRNKLVSLAVGALAVTAFAACSDDDDPGVDTPTDTGVTDTGFTDTLPTTPTS
jgi:hypothetical protein